MNCYYHPEVAASAYCRTCCKALCPDCKRTGHGIIYCEEHLPAGAPAVAVSPPAAPPPVAAQASSGLAFALGLIPGVGAIYNGQYAKGLIHAVVFGLLVSLANSVPGEVEALFVMLCIAFVAYMAFEAQHTARKRNLGEPVDEFSSLFNLRDSSSAGAIVLIVLGVVFLLNTLDILSLRQILKFWPVLLILLGANMLYSRLSAQSHESGEEVHHERQ